MIGEDEEERSPKRPEYTYRMTVQSAREGDKARPDQTSLEEVLSGVHSKRNEAPIAQEGQDG